MMQRLEVLNTRVVKKIIAQLEEQFGYAERPNVAFLKSSKDKLYIITRDVNLVNYDELRLESIGIYFASIENDGLRLSIEGSQMVGPKATKNVLELNDEQFTDWFKGKNVLLESSTQKVGDSVVFDISSGKIVDTIHFEKGAAILLTGGKHVEVIGIVEDIKEDVLVFKNEKGKVFETIKKHAYVLGKGKPVVNVR